MTTETPIQLIRSVRDALRGWGIGSDKPISGVDSVEYLTELLQRTDKLLKGWYPEEYTAGAALLDAAERVSAVYQADAEDDVIHDAVVELDDAYRIYRRAAATPADPARDPARGNVIIVTGNPIDGLEFIGPFPWDDEAIAFAERWSQHEVDWWIGTLQEPEAA